MAESRSPDEEARDAPLGNALDFIGPEPDERFDRLTRLAQRLFDTPIAMLSLTGSDRQWFQSRFVRDPRETPRELGFVAQATPDEDILIVPDARADARFRDHPLVTDLPEIRFYVGCPVKAPDGSALGTLCVIDHEPREVGEEEARALRDLAWMLEQEIRSASLATQDELTGLANRRGFEKIAAHTIAMCRRVGEPATLLYFDLDNFKDVNDTLGHLAGDRVLRSFSGHLQSTFRDSDVVARVGGDEFCVLLTSATTEDVDRPLALLEGRLKTRDGEPIVSFSVGVASYDPVRHLNLQALVDEADLRMYQQKRARQQEGETRHGTD